MSKVFDLAKANIEAGDSEQALKNLERQVRDNKHSWANSAVVAERAVEAASDKLACLKSNPCATAEQLISATDCLALAERSVEIIAELAGERF